MAKTLFIPGLTSKTDAKNGVRKMKLTSTRRVSFRSPSRAVKREMFQNSKCH